MVDDIASGVGPKSVQKFANTWRWATGNRDIKIKSIKLFLTSLQSRVNSGD